MGNCRFVVCFLRVGFWVILFVLEDVEFERLMCVVIVRLCKIRFFWIDLVEEGVVGKMW